MNTDKVILVVAIVIIVILVSIQYVAIKNSTTNNVTNYELLQSIDSLRYKIDSLEFSREKLRTVVDTNKVKIIEIEKKYETVRNHIITQSIDSDCVFFSNYLSNYSGFISGNDSTTTKVD